MQRGMFARKRVVLQQRICAGAWIGHPAAIVNKDHSSATNEKAEESSKSASEEATYTTNKNTQLVQDTGREVSRIADAEAELKEGQTLNMRVHSISPTEVLLQCPNNVWGHLHAVDLPLLATSASSTAGKENF
ncbi:unnamed protein product, partial [Amoebophrya sp. A25]|eukprot:GSA25T00004282001.1